VFVLGGVASEEHRLETDFRSVRRRLEQVRRAVLPMNVLGAGSFVLLFVGLPIAEALHFFHAVALWVLGVVLGGHVPQLLVRRRALRRLGLRSHGSESLLFAASPLLSMRAGCVAAMRAFEGYEPLAVTFVLAPARTFLEFCHERLGRGPLSASE